MYSCKDTTKTLDVFKEKEHQVKRSRIDCPAAWGGVAYCHNKAVRASSFVSWKIVREKAPHIAVENFIKPAAVEMARILCGDAVANKLAMVPLSNDTIKWRIQEISEGVLQQTIASVKRRRLYGAVFVLPSSCQKYQESKYLRK